MTCALSPALLLVLPSYILYSTLLFVCHVASPVDFPIARVLLPTLSCCIPTIFSFRSGMEEILDPFWIPWELCSCLTCETVCVHVTRHSPQRRRTRLLEQIRARDRWRQIRVEKRNLTPTSGGRVSRFSAYGNSSDLATSSHLDEQQLS